MYIQENMRFYCFNINAIMNNKENSYLESHRNNEGKLEGLYIQVMTWLEQHTMFNPCLPCTSSLIQINVLWYDSMNIHKMNSTLVKVRLLIVQCAWPKGSSLAPTRNCTLYPGQYEDIYEWRMLILYRNNNERSQYKNIIRH